MEPKVIDEDLEQQREKENQRRSFSGFLIPAILLLILFLVPVVLAGITWYEKGELPSGLYKRNASGKPLVLSFYRIR